MLTLMRDMPYPPEIIIECPAGRKSIFCKPGIKHNTARIGAQNAASKLRNEFSSGKKKVNFLQKSITRTADAGINSSAEKYRE